MKKKIILLLIAVLALSSILISGTLEREGNIAYVNADSLFKQKEYLKAIESYEKALNKYKMAAKKENALVQDHVNEILLGKLWKAYYFAKNYDKAIEILKNNLNMKNLSSSKKKKIEKTIITIYKKKKDIKGAIDFLLERENIKPALWREKKIGLLYYKLKDYRNALVWFKKVKEKKSSTDIIKRIANCYIKLKDYKSAVNTYELYLKTLDMSKSGTSTKLKTTYKNMASLYYNINEYNKAILYWEKVLKLGYDKEIAMNLMLKYYELKKYDKALSKANLLLKKNPGLADALYYKAKIYYDRGDKKTARKYFARVKNNPIYGKTAKEFIKSIDSE